MATISLHRTKKGAYRAMNTYLNNKFNEAREEQIRYGKHEIFDHVFMHEAWAVRPIELKE
jgi:hypothetical protein